MCTQQAQESAGGRAGESKEKVFKQKYRLENKQRRARESERENVCMYVCACACVSVCVSVCACAHDRRRAAPAAEPKIIRCTREHSLPLRVAGAAAYTDTITRAAPDSSSGRQLTDPGAPASGLNA